MSGSSLLVLTMSALMSWASLSAWMSSASLSALMSWASLSAWMSSASLSA